MLKQRILTAVPLAAAFLAALFYLPFSAFAGLIAALLLLAGWERGPAGLRAGPGSPARAGVLGALCCAGAA